MTDETAETDRIERELAETRARMDNRLGELQEKMSPAQLVNDAFVYVQGGDGADFSANLISRAKANPLPAALVGVGLAWLMASKHTRTSSSGHAVSSDLHFRLNDVERHVMRFEGEDEVSYTGRLDEARGHILGVPRDASDTPASYAQRIKDAVASATQMLRSTAHDAQDGARKTVAGFGGGTHAPAPAAYGGSIGASGKAKGSLASAASSPLAIGALAVAVGAIAGSLLPTLDVEEAALGSLAGKLKNGGRDLAQDVVDRGGRVASETLAAVKDNADAHGLTSGKPIGDVVQGLRSGSLVNDVKTVAQETLQASRDSAQAHFTGDRNADPQLL
jgi:hypothetical protein